MCEVDKRIRTNSRYKSTAHARVFQHKGLNFGISTASEIFQETICSIIQNIQGVKNISDDIIVFGKTKAEPDSALQATSQRFEEKGLTLN